MLFLAIICLAYYAKYIPAIGNNIVLLWVINVISLIIAVLYSLLNNWRFIKGIIVTVKSKFHKKNIEEN